MHIIKGRSEPITALKFSPNGKLLAVGGKDCEIIIHAFNTKKTKIISKIRAHKAPILNLDFSRKGKVL